MCVCVCVHAQSRLTLCGPSDCSPPGSSVHEIFQARILEWASMPSSRDSFPTQGSNPCLLHLVPRQAGSLPGEPPLLPKDTLRGICGVGACSLNTQTHKHTCTQTHTFLFLATKRESAHLRRSKCYHRELEKISGPSQRREASGPSIYNILVPLLLLSFQLWYRRSHLPFISSRSH